MLPADMSRSVAALLISALASGQVDRAAAQDVAPLDPSQCSTLARTVSHAVGIALKTTVGKSNVAGTHGTACLMSGSATGLTLEFESARQELEASLARGGWTAVSDFDADGPDSTQ